jgi:hypothetical protein
VRYKEDIHIAIGDMKSKIEEIHKEVEKLVSKIEGR